MNAPRRQRLLPSFLDYCSFQIPGFRTRTVSAAGQHGTKAVLGKSTLVCRDYTGVGASKSVSHLPCPAVAAGRPGWDKGNFVFSLPVPGKRHPSGQENSWFSGQDTHGRDNQGNIWLPSKCNGHVIPPPPRSKATLGNIIPTSQSLSYLSG